MSFLLNDHSAKVEGVQSFPHLEAQHGAITLASYKYLLRYHFSKEIGVSMRVEIIEQNAKL